MLFLEIRAYHIDNDLCYNLSLKVFQVKVMKYYAEQTLQHPLPKSQEGIEDDVLQMGGDFTIKVKDKTLVFSYPSKSPSDRPSIDNIFRKTTT